MADRKPEPLKDLEQIRSMMERSSTFVSLSGFSGVIAGFLGIAAGMILGLKTHTFMVMKDRFNPMFAQPSFFIFFILLMGLTLLISILCSFILSSMKAKKLKLNIWNPSSKRFAIGLFTPLLCGGLLMTAFFLQKQFEFFFPFALIFYGLSLINASDHTLPEIKYLGISECILGVISAFILPVGLICWIAGFGLLNIGYGTLMYMKYER